jgi:hypothetical protein
MIRAVVAAAHPPRHPKPADPRVGAAAATEWKEKGRMNKEKTGAADIFPVHPARTPSQLLSA